MRKQRVEEERASTIPIAEPEKPTYRLAVDYLELFVLRRDGKRRGVNDEDHQFIHERLEFVNVLGRHRDSDDDALGTVRCDSPECRAHCGTGCDAVVHHDDRFSTKGGQRMTAVLLDAPRQLGALILRDALDEPARHPNEPAYAVVTDEVTAFCDGAQSDLAHSRHAKFARYDDIQRSAKRIRHAPRNDHAAPWQGENHEVRCAREVCDVRGQLSPSVLAVAKPRPCNHVVRPCHPRPTRRDSSVAVQRCTAALL